MNGKYDDIIGLERPVSHTRRHLTNKERAAQFAPFAALTGFGALIDETSDEVNSHDDDIEKEQV